MDRRTVALAYLSAAKSETPPLLVALLAEVETATPERLAELSEAAHRALSRLLEYAARAAEELSCDA